MFKILANNFLGKNPPWYKLAILSFLIANPLVFHLVSPFAAGWLLLVEFLFTLALALKCYPIPSGGLLALEAVIVGFTSPESIYKEVANNLPTLLLLIFMVSGVYYLKDLLFLIFTRAFVSIRRKSVLSFTIALISLLISAFLDALTLMAVITAVGFNFSAIYRGLKSLDSGGGENNRLEALEYEEFHGFLRNIVMHGAIGTILGGTLTVVGEPQNMMIGSMMDWSFGEFFVQCSVVSLPAVAVGIALCPLLEIFKFPGYGHELPEKARQMILRDYREMMRLVSKQTVFLCCAQGMVFVLLILALAFHVAEIGLIGIAVIVVLTALTGTTKEHDFASAFGSAMPFVTLLAIFFAILAVVHDQHLVTPLASWVFGFEGRTQLVMLYVVNGALSFVSDNVFIASVFINEIRQAFEAGAFSRQWYEKLAVVVNMGTNVVAMATPNGHAALLFLLTSSLAPVIELSYTRMVKLALPYTVVISITGGLAVYFLL
ncbi:MAG: sodium/proton antiporter [Candidatus Accumulibacter sp.]|jgi:NhaB family Na+:H+ antiporter|nr:sodium/proton antiporter [Accumulibacter sp.]